MVTLLFSGKACLQNLIWSDECEMHHFPLWMPMARHQHSCDRSSYCIDSMWYLCIPKQFLMLEVRLLGNADGVNSNGTISNGSNFQHASIEPSSWYSGTSRKFTTRDLLRTLFTLNFAELSCFLRNMYFRTSVVIPVVVLHVNENLI
jgi:hypothetical protein